MRNNISNLDPRFKEIDDHYRRIDHLKGAPHIKPAVKATADDLEKELVIKANILVVKSNFV